MGGAILLVGGRERAQDHGRIVPRDHGDCRPDQPIIYPRPNKIADLLIRFQPRSLPHWLHRQCQRTTGLRRMTEHAQPVVKSFVLAEQYHSA